MLTVLSCIATQHDVRLVALAAVICSLASLTAVSLLHHVERSEAAARRVWLAIAAVATGFGVWATHFIAMLAFEPTLPSGYELAPTLVSLVAAIGLTGVGLAVALDRRIPYGRWLGGAAVGGGVAVMHYTGMAAFEVAGAITWDMQMVLASIALGAAFGALSIGIGLRADGPAWKLAGGLTLALAICSLHFTGMAAVMIVPDPRIVVPEAAMPPAFLATAVAIASSVIILLALAVLSVDLRERRRVAGEAGRMRDFADAAVEGLVVCSGAEIVAANKSFAALVGAQPGQIAGRSVAAFFPVWSDSRNIGGIAEGEVALRTEDGSTIPVELIVKTVAYGGKRHEILAVRDLRERKKAEEEIYFLAHHDPLTKLANRTSFNKQLDSEIAAHCGTGSHVAVLLLDLDRFKQINDLFGHPTGDCVLQGVAERIAGVPGERALVARLGGDEFAVILPGLADPSEVTPTAQAILRALAENGEDLPAGAAVRTSIGIAVYPQDGSDRATLLSHADAALYQAKAEGRGIFRFFDESMGAHLRDRRQLEHDIRQAVLKDELSLVYQPQADLQSSKVFGFEALLRWQHPVRGSVSPAVFIPIAEECGAIHEIGEWVLRTACMEAAQWERPLLIAVNISAVQLHGANFPGLVEDVLRDTGLDPSRLELEITETALIRDVGRALSVLRRVRSLGVRIAMDDFGTGYSSLSNLRAFPFDKIKIDQSFVRSVDTSKEAAAIVRAVVGLARGLNLPVLAEGVETDAELRFLRAEACTSIQGYLLGRPKPIADFGELTRSDPPASAQPVRQREFGAAQVQIA